MADRAVFGAHAAQNKGEDDPCVMLLGLGLSDRVQRAYAPEKSTAGGDIKANGKGTETSLGTVSAMGELDRNQGVA